MYCPVNELEQAEHRSAAAVLVETPPAPADDPSGDAARDALFAEFQPLVQRLMRQYADNAELRQDLPGEIFHRFCCLYEAYDPSRGIPLRPYMVRMLTASVYNFMRSNWRHQNRELQMLPEVGEDPAYAGEDGTPEWIQSLWMQETLAQLPAVIAQLPARQQQVVIWRYYHALSFEEIADKLLVRPATVRSLLRHAIAHLRRKLTSEPE